MIQVRSAKHTTGTKLRVEFNDGTAGVVDLGEELGKGRTVAEVKAMLAKVMIDGGSPFFEAEPDAHFAPSWYYARAHDMKVPETHEEAWANETVMSLRKLRVEAGFNQTKVAMLAGISQPEVVRIEKQGDMKLSTLFGYLSALGWELELGARRGTKRVQFGPFGSVAEVGPKMAAKKSVKAKAKAREATARSR